MKNILIIDDNKVNLAAARNVLSGTYKITPVLRGAQALTYLETGSCDIILLDINMPEMNGFEVLREIRKIEHCKNTPVIFLTADNDVKTLLFTISEADAQFLDISETELALELLEQAIHTSLRRSDVSTRYSSKQLIVFLMGANHENSEMVAERILHASGSFIKGTKSA